MGLREAISAERLQLPERDERELEPVDAAHQGEGQDQQLFSRLNTTLQV